MAGESRAFILTTYRPANNGDQLADRRVIICTLSNLALSALWGIVIFGEGQISKNILAKGEFTYRA